MYDQRTHRLAIERRSCEIVLVRDVGAQHTVQLVLDKRYGLVSLQFLVEDSVRVPFRLIHGVESAGEQFTGGVALEDSQLECPILCRFDSGN